jgi:vanadium chloroperoxidase
MGCEGVIVREHYLDIPTILTGRLEMVDRDVVLYWNSVAMEAVAQDFSTDETPEQKGPTATSRAMAMVHIGMHDAYLGVVGAAAGPKNPNGYGLYSPVIVAPPPGAQEETAVTAAALTLLNALYPRQRERFESRHQESPFNLSGTDPGWEYGMSIAEQVLASRATDNAQSTIQDLGEAAYAYSHQYGRHRPDPVTASHGSRSLHPRWGLVTPFQASLQPLPPPPGYALANYLGDPVYLNHHNEVLTRGGHPSLNSTNRSAEQTAIGLFWAYDGPKGLGTPPRLYNQIMRKLSDQHALPVWDNARLLFLVNIAMADAGIQAWHWKYVYNLWRPVIGIREADPNVGPAASPGTISGPCDPAWRPLGAPQTNGEGKPDFTPNFPAYPSGHATFGGAALQVARLFLKQRNGLAFDDHAADALAFHFVSDELDGKQEGTDGILRPRHNRQFPSVWRAMIENGESRIWLGVHWRFDAFVNVADLGNPAGKIGGIPLGMSIADAVWAAFPQ